VDGISATRSASVTGLTNGTSFDFRVLSTNVVGSSSYSSSVSGTPRTTPDAPTGVTIASVGDGQLDVTWTAPTDVGGSALTDYAVQYATSSGYSWTTVTRTASTTTSQSITGLTNGTSYQVRVGSINAAGTGTFATAVSGTPVTDPGVPRTVTASVSGTSATISWLAPLSDGGSVITDYEIDYKTTTSSSWTSWTHSASTATSATLTGLTGLSAGTRYDVRVRTVTAVGTSPYASTSFPALQTGGGSSGGTTTTPSNGGGTTTTSPPAQTNLPVGVVLGEGLVLVDGEWVSVQPQWNSSGGTLVVKTDEFSLAFQVDFGGSDSQREQTTDLRARVGGQVDFTGTGYLRNSSVSAYLIPRELLGRAARASRKSILLGETTVDALGNCDVTMTVPVSVDPGDYVLQVNGWSESASVRSVNMNMDIAEAMSEHSMTNAAFFQGRSTKFSKNGRTKLRTMIEKLPDDRQDVQIAITAVSVSLDEIDEDLELAAKRGRELRSYLSQWGVTGEFTVNVMTKERLRSASSPPVRYSSRGKPLTTVEITYMVAD